jgi:hypothetical protein
VQAGQAHGAGGVDEVAPEHAGADPGDPPVLVDGQLADAPVRSSTAWPSRPCSGAAPWPVPCGATASPAAAAAWSSSATSSAKAGYATAAGNVAAWTFHGARARS